MNRTTTLVLISFLGLSCKRAPAVADRVVAIDPGPGDQISPELAEQLSRSPRMAAALTAQATCAALKSAGCAIGDDPRCVQQLEFADARRERGAPSVFAVLARKREVKVSAQARAQVEVGAGGVTCMRAADAGG